MPGHDPQRTSRSDGVGPAHPHLLFHRPSTLISAVGPDGTMVGAVQEGGRSLVADLSPDGHLLWKYPFDGPPVIEPDGTVVVVGFTTVPAGSADQAGRWALSGGEGALENSTVRAV